VAAGAAMAAALFVPVINYSCQDITIAVKSLVSRGIDYIAFCLFPLVSTLLSMAGGIAVSDNHFNL
jgi:hypothetical protein